MSDDNHISIGFDETDSDTTHQDNLDALDGYQHRFVDDGGDRALTGGRRVGRTTTLAMAIIDALAPDFEDDVHCIAPSGQMQPALRKTIRETIPDDVDADPINPYAMDLGPGGRISILSTGHDFVDRKLKVSDDVALIAIDEAQYLDSETFSTIQKRRLAFTDDPVCPLAVTAQPSEHHVKGYPDQLLHWLIEADTTHIWTPMTSCDRISEEAIAEFQSSMTPDQVVREVLGATIPGVDYVATDDGDLDAR